MEKILFAIGIEEVEGWIMNNLEKKYPGQYNSVGFIVHGEALEEKIQSTNPDIVVVKDNLPYTGDIDFVNYVVRLKEIYTEVRFVYVAMGKKAGNPDLQLLATRQIYDIVFGTNTWNTVIDFIVHPQKFSYAVKFISKFQAEGFELEEKEEENKDENIPKESEKDESSPIKQGVSSFINKGLLSKNKQLSNKVKELENKLSVSNKPVNRSIVSFIGGSYASGTTSLALLTAIDLAKKNKGNVLFLEINPKYSKVLNFFGVPDTSDSGFEKLLHIDLDLIDKVVFTKKELFNLIPSVFKANLASWPDNLSFAQFSHNYGENELESLNPQEFLRSLLQVQNFRNYTYVIVDFSYFVSAPLKQYFIDNSTHSFVVITGDYKDIQMCYNSGLDFTGKGAINNKISLIVNKYKSKSWLNFKEIEDFLDLVGKGMSIDFIQDYLLPMEWQAVCPIKKEMPMTLSNAINEITERIEKSNV